MVQFLFFQSVSLCLLSRNCFSSVLNFSFFSISLSLCGRFVLRCSAVCVAVWFVFDCFSSVELGM